MEAVCIEDNFTKQGGVPEIVKGNVYHIIDEKSFSNERRSGYTIDGMYYKLIETNCWYHSSLFIIINDGQMDEAEIKKTELNKLSK